MLYKKLDQDRLLGGRVAGREVTSGEAIAAAGTALKNAKKVALVASGHLTNEDNAALLLLAEALGQKAEVFGGSWLPVGKPDGIARSGDPVANRKGCAWLNIPENLDQLVARSAEFDCLLVLGNDLCGQNAHAAHALASIQQRIVLGSWRDATAAAATIAIGMRCWAEVRGTMVNCQGRVQMLHAVPVCPDAALEAPWAVLSSIAAAAGAPLAIVSEGDAWREYRRRVPSLAEVSYRQIGPMGYLVPATTPAPVGAGA
jgi:NADH-quinone oxidoreductase subunit G